MPRLAAIAMLFAATAGAAQAAPELRVVGTRFELTTASGQRLTGADLQGAQLESTDAAGRAHTLRIDAVSPSTERPGVLLHVFSERDPKTGAWRPLCQPDSRGRQAGFPVAGAWDSRGRYVKDASTWFITCTSGSQGKCILWGYDPWTAGPAGEDLTRHYQACQYMARADYTAKGAPFTRNGTTIDMWDDAGVQVSDTAGDPAFAFEAGWGPDGAVCVARTRWPSLLPTRVLHESAPALAAPVCDEAEARARGALLFNRSRSE